jgi:protein-disulfide isomerase
VIARCAFVLALLAAGCGASRPPLAADACRAWPADRPPPWEGRGHALDVPASAPRRGAEHPRVVIQVFSDFECPYCARAEPTLERALAEYGACTAIVWRNRPMPYHRNAALAARAAHEVHRQAGDAAFWRFHDRLFADQEHLGRSDLERIATSIEGVDLAAFIAALEGDAHIEVLREDQRALNRISARYGTPTFVVNGTVIVGAKPYEEFQAAIEDALRDAYGESE